MVKINTRGFCKDTIENGTDYFPGGSYLTLKINSTVSRYRLLVAIGYKYNVRKVLSLIDTED